MKVQRPKMLNERRLTFGDKVFSVLCTIVVVLLLAVTVFNLWFVNNYFVVQVDGDSMNYTLTDGDMLYTKRGNAQAERGEIVIINVEKYKDKGFSEKTKLIIKRLIAVEGDCIKCENGVVYLKKTGGKYEPLDEPYAKGRTDDFNEVAVGEGEIFFLGDNRDNSKDSSRVGCLEMADIIGVVPEWAVEIKEFSTKWESGKNSFLTE